MKREIGTVSYKSSLKVGRKHERLSGIVFVIVGKLVQLGVIICEQELQVVVVTFLQVKPIEKSVTVYEEV